MKLDKIKFATLIGFISCRYALTITQDDMQEIDEIINIEAPTPAYKFDANAIADLSLLMKLMAQGTHKIEAVKLHRQLTGWGLKESKDAVEAVWIAKPMLNTADQLYVKADAENQKDAADADAGKFLTGEQVS